MIFQENENLSSIYFESIVEFFNYKNDFERNENLKNKYLERTSSGDKIGPWNNSGSDVVRNAIYGDEKADAMMTEMSNRLFSGAVEDFETTIQKVKRKRRAAAFGDEFDIHKAYQGHFNSAWNRMERVEMDHKHHLITLFFDIGANWNVDFSKTLWTGAVINKLCSEISASGKSVRIVACSFARHAFLNDNRKLISAMVIKDYFDSLSSEKISAMTHLGFFRTVFFSMFFCGHNKRISENLGQHLDISIDYLPLQIKDEIDSCKMKPIIVKRATCINSAKRSLSDVYAQMKK